MTIGDQRQLKKSSETSINIRVFIESAWNDPTCRRQDICIVSKLGLPDLEFAKASVLGSLPSPESQRGIGMRSTNSSAGIVPNHAFPSTRASLPVTEFTEATAQRVGLKSGGTTSTARSRMQPKRAVMFESYCLIPSRPVTWRSGDSSA